MRKAGLKPQDTEAIEPIKVDWKKVRREFKKLGIPEDVYNPMQIPWERNSWFLLLSERSIGKTTNVLLLGLILNKLYGIQIQYIRERSDMLAPKNADKLFSVILNHGYIGKLTDGKYNTIFYRSKKWKYGRYDIDTGKIVEESDIVVSCLSIEENLIYKSTYNAPKGDFIIFDECISKYWYANEFPDFCDLTCTVGRFRPGVKIVCLANTIDPYAPFLEEINAQQIVEGLEIGQNAEYRTEEGTPVYVELCGNYNPKKRELSRLFYGFKNPKLKSITGAGWAINNYPHNTFEDYTVIDKSHFIQCSNNVIVQLELCRAEGIGLFVNVHKATKLRDNDIIWTTGTITESRQRFKFGFSKYDKYLVTLKQRNRWYYSSNMIGSLVATYFRTAETLEK